MNDIKINREDALELTVSALIDGTTEEYEFQVGDVVRIKIMQEKNCKNVVLQKDTIVSSVGTSVEIALTSEDTRIGDIVSKPITYWYEITLNPETNKKTLVGYEDAPALFIIRPEGADRDD